MNRRIVSIAGLALAICLIGGTAARATGNLEVVTNAGSTIGNRVWDPASLPIVWRFNDPSTVAGCNYSSATAPAATLQAPIAAGFTTWQNDPDSTMTFSYGGTTAVRTPGNDGVNVVTFCSTLAFSAGVIASTPTTAITVQTTVLPGGGCPAGQGTAAGIPFCFPTGVYPAGTIIDGDIQFNGTNPATAEASLSTGNPADTTQAGKFDVQAVVTHEQGHFFGLSHDPIFQAVMFPFVDDDPFSDGAGQRVLKPSDKSTAGHYYPAATYGTNFGSITGFITLDGLQADGVHVAAIDPNTMLGYTGRFSISQFEDPVALGTEGPDFAANGAGFYRIDGLPPGNYYVYVEYFDATDSFTGRLGNRYNTTVGNSNISNGNPTSTGQIAGVWAGFLPALTEFYDAAESGNGGNGVAAGTATDNSDAASLVPVVAGSATSGINIDINIEPVNGQTAANRQNPTTRSILVNDNFQGTDVNTAFLLNGGNDDFYAIRYPAASLPTPPYNVAEGQWGRYGKNDLNYNVMLTFSDPNNSALPAFNDPIVSSAGRFLSGGPNGKTDAGDVVDMRDQWNVTVNTSRDVWIVMNQPPSAAGITLLTQGYFILVTRTAAPTSNCRICRTLITQNGGTTWGTLTADVLYDLILERTPPVLITGATPATGDEGSTFDVTVNGVGFVPGAVCNFGPNITVNSSTFLSAAQVRCNITIANTGATVNRGVNVKITNPNMIISNVSRVFTVTPFLDSDGDGVGNGNDCAPLDATLKHAATEVLNDTVTLSGPSTLYSWDSQDLLNGTGTVYDVVSGLVSDLLASRDFSAAGCAVNDLGDSPFTDPNPDPAAGNARYYLVRARNTCNVGNATYGDSSLVSDPRDALDAGAPCP